MKTLLIIIGILVSVAGFAQTEPIAPEYIRTDSIVGFTTDVNLKLVGLGTGLVEIEGAYTLPGTDGSDGQVLTTDGNGVVGFEDVTTVTFGTDNQIPFVNSGGTDFDYSANHTFDGSTWNLTGAGNITGDLDVDSLNFNGSTISTNADVDITVDPSGDGKFYVVLNNNYSLFNHTTTAGAVIRIAQDGTEYGSIDRSTTSGGAFEVRSLNATPLRLSSATGTIDINSNNLGNIGTINGLTISGAGTLTIPTSSSLIRSGAHAMTLTTSGATNVTFPTTGTLATIAGIETLTNKTLTSPVISTITNSAGDITLTPNPSNAVNISGGADLEMDGTVVITDARAASFTTGTFSGDVLIESADDTGVRIRETGAANSEWYLYTPDGVNELRLYHPNTTTNHIVISSAGNMTLTGTLGLTATRVSTGFFTNITSTNAVNVDSDRRLKKHIRKSDYGLDEILALTPVSYKWKKSEDKGKHLGLIAQETKKIIPEIVNYREDGYMGITYTELIPVLIQAIQEQQEQIEDLKNQLK